MLPSDVYRLYQVERPKSPAQTRCADEQAAHLASAVSRLFRAITRPALAAHRPCPADRHAGASRPAEPATCRDVMARAMEGS